MGPIRGQTRPLPVTADIVPKADAQLNASIHNRFDIEVIDVTTGKVRQRAQAENLICDQLWTYFASGAWNNYIAIGTGAGTPSASDKTLFNHLAYYGQSNEKISVDSANGIAKRQCKCKLTETEHVGKSLTEVGILQSTTSSTLCTHAMFKDANGNTISILKTATDIINIYSTVFVHFTAAKSAMVKAPLIIGDTGLLKTLFGTSGLGSIPYVYYSPGVCLTYAVSVGLSCAFDKTTKKLTYTAARLGADNGNDYPISFISPASSGGVSGRWFPQFVIDVGAFSSGTDIVSEPVGTGDGTAKAFSTKFPFASSAKIYVNGVEQSTGVQVTSLPTNRKKAQMYFHGLNPSTLQTMLPVWEWGDNAAVFYNPYYEIGVSSAIAKSSQTQVTCSDDLISWVSPIAKDSALTVGNEYAVVSAYQHYKYWHVESNKPADLMLNCADNSIVFDTAPASGAVITADYHTPVIAKDANHVFDFSMTVQLGEHTG